MVLGWFLGFRVLGILVQGFWGFWVLGFWGIFQDYIQLTPSRAKRK